MTRKRGVNSTAAQRVGRGRISVNFFICNSNVRAWDMKVDMTFHIELAMRRQHSGIDTSAIA